MASRTVTVNVEISKRGSIYVALVRVNDSAGKRNWVGSGGSAKTPLAALDAARQDITESLSFSKRGRKRLGHSESLLTLEYGWEDGHGK